MQPKHLFIALTVACLPLGSQAQTANHPEWTTALPPFRIAENLYYVGSQDLASYLITTTAGNILINANLERSPAQIRASVEQLGFKWKDVKILLNNQAHFDHVAGAAQILHETHAQNWVMEGDADVMESGGRTDFAFGPELQFPKAHVDKILHDGSLVRLGGTTLVAHKTAGHTRGCTTWTLRAHLPGEPSNKLRDVVIAGGFMALPEYRLVAKKGQPTSYPGITSDFKKMFRDMRRYACDVFLGAHGSYFGMLDKLERLPKQGADVWIDPKGYQAKIEESERTFNKQLAAAQSSKK